MVVEAPDYLIGEGEPRRGPAPKVEDPSSGPEPLSGVGRWAMEVREAIAAQALHDGLVIIAGERGTGKRFVARRIHEASTRNDGPFITVSPALFPETAWEEVLRGSTLGRAAGAGRSQERPGRCASGGTLYVEWVPGVLPRPREDFLESVKARGAQLTPGSPLRRIDPRLILGLTIPDRDPPQEANGTSWRFHGPGWIDLPRLRERGADFELLVRHFLRQCCQTTGRELRVISSEVLELLRRHRWPGNASELKQVIQDVIEQAGPPRVDREHMPYYLDAADFVGRVLPGEDFDLFREMARFERSILEAALQQAGGVQTRAARILGLNATTLNSKLARHGLDPRTMTRPKRATEGSCRRAQGRVGQGHNRKV